MKLYTAFGALLVAATLSTGALAADAGAPVDTNPGFDWNGFYAGIIVGGEADFLGGTWIDGGGAVGALFSLDSDLVLNIEGSLLGYTGTSSGYEAELSSRLGVAMSDVLLYGMAGVGSDTGTGYFSYGVGLWVPASDKVSVRVEVDGNSYFGSSMLDWAAINFGAFLHF